MTPEPIWLEKAALLSLHAQSIARYGGSPELRDEALLESALARPRHAFAYGEMDIHTLAASLASGIVRNHPFVDGNKRAGYIAAYIFLGRNGFVLEVDKTEAVARFISLAASELSEEDLEKWFRANTIPAT